MEDQSIDYGSEATVNDIINEDVKNEDTLGDRDELTELREELERLRTALAEKELQDSKIAKQLSEFGELFPDEDLNTVPDDVWESVRLGNSLPAAFALYRRRLEISQQRCRDVNQKNKMTSAGPVGMGIKEYFTPDEVRAMSQGEVHANYQKIISSMKKWG